MSWLFKCKHPAEWLHINKESPTREFIDADFDKVTFSLVCMKCGEIVEISASTFRGGAAAFLERGKPKADAV